MTALDKLIAAVEAGADLPRPIPFPAGQVALVLGAFDGSLDAAMELHEALLPGWDWGRQGKIFIYVFPAKSPKRENRHHGHSDDNLARAWLLAILHAKRAMGE